MRAQYKTSVRGGARASFPLAKFLTSAAGRCPFPLAKSITPAPRASIFSHRPKTTPATAENKMNHIAWSFLTLGIQRVATRMMAAKTR